MKRWTSKAVVMAAFALGAGSASAQQCVGFGDVLASDGICPGVEWIRNRGVTLGCTATTYCPTDVVTRGSMALFMQRLGKALSSEVHKDHVTEFNATIPGESPTPPLLLCAMAGDSTVKPYPRQALLNASVAGLANGSSVAWRAFWIYSIDGGTTFQPISDGANFISTPRASSGPNQWSGVALSFALDLPASTPLQVRVVVRRDNILTGTTGNFADARCQMTVNIVNANGTTSPL